MAATSPGTISHVLFYVDGILAWRASASPYTLSLDSGSLFANGNHVLLARKIYGKIIK